MFKRGEAPRHFLKVIDFLEKYGHFQSEFPLEQVRMENPICGKSKTEQRGIFSVEDNASLS